jgi:hypothetical protein
MSHGSHRMEHPARLQQTCSVMTPAPQNYELSQPPQAP